MFKNNTLLVRLNSAENKIKALQQIPEYGTAEILRLKIIEENQKTINAFKENYHFSKVYFFETSEAHNLKYQKFDQVKLSDVNNVEVTDKSFLKDGYLVTTFGQVVQDPLIYEDNKNTRYQVAGTNSLPGLVILDSDYVQLKKPFPFRVMTNHNEASKEESVTLLNSNFEQFYFKYERKKLKMKYLKTD